MAGTICPPPERETDPMMQSDIEPPSVSLLFFVSGGGSFKHSNLQCNAGSQLDARRRSLCRAPERRQIVTPHPGSCRNVGSKVSQLTVCECFGQHQQSLFLCAPLQDSRKNLPRSDPCSRDTQATALGPLGRFVESGTCPSV